MKYVISEKSKFKKVESIEEFVLENGWFIPSLHKKYLVDVGIKNRKN